MLEGNINVDVDLSVVDPMEAKIDDIVTRYPIDNFHNLNGFASHGEVPEKEV